MEKERRTNVIANTFSSLIKTWVDRANKAEKKSEESTNDFTVERLITEMDIYLICVEELELLVTEEDRKDTT